MSKWLALNVLVACIPFFVNFFPTWFIGVYPLYSWGLKWLWTLWLIGASIGYFLVI